MGGNKKKECEESDPFDEFLAELNKALNAGKSKGAPTIHYIKRADDVENPFIIRRPTGITSIDISIGGGWPAGGISQIAGPDGAGKNALCWQTIATSQAIYGKESRIGWCWTEFPIDKEFGRLFGATIPESVENIKLINEARSRLGKPKLSKDEVKFLKHSVGEFIVVDRGSTEKRLQAIVEMARSNFFQILVVDSVAALLPLAVEKVDLQDEPQQSSEARLLTRFQQKIWGAYQDGDPTDQTSNLTTILVINQVRSNRSLAKFKKEWKVSGAHALRHGKLVDLHINKAERIPKTGKAIGRKTKWEIAKGKAGCHDGPTGLVDFYYDTGFAIEKDLISVASDKELLLTSGKGSVLVNPDGEVVEEGLPHENHLPGKVIKDPAWGNKVRDLIFQKEEIECLFKEP